MFIIGKATPEERKEIEEWGWDVEDVDVEHFDCAIDPNYGHCAEPHTQEIATGHENDTDQLISVFVDQDIHAELKKVHNQEKAMEECHRQKLLDEKRRHLADELFEKVCDDLPEDMPYADDNGWHCWGNGYTKNFFYESNIAGEDSIMGTFHIMFEDGTATPIETRTSNVPEKMEA